MPPRKKPARSKKAATAKRVPLREYDDKRDFQSTPEPSSAATTASTAQGEGPLTFVVQKHDATRLHYDVRLEVDGVLKSWPVPRGPSLDPAEKRLAVMTEDHPLDYATFEGVIPKGQYGAGEVIVWDHGTYSPDEGGQLSFHDRAEAESRMREGIEGGKLSVQLRGHKLKGSWTLVKTQQSEDSWLLIKHQDEAVDEQRDVVDEDASVISALTVAEVKAGRLPDRSRPSTPVRLGDLPGAKRGKPPAKAAPMLATATAEAFSSDEWLFEPKLDGIRALALVDGESVLLRSRTGRPITDQYPSLAAALAEQPAGSMLLDGEIVALDEHGVPSFEVLQQRMNLLGSHDIERAEADVPVIFFAFDLLYLDGYDLRRVPLRHRKAMLARTLLPTARVQAVEHFERDGEAAYEAVRDLGFEGVVAKRADSKYEGGKRSRSWLKVKATLSDEFVVVGFSPGNGARAATFGSLLLGTHNDDGELVAAGRVGGGFDDATLAEIRRSLDRITRKTCPLPGGVPEDAGDATWVTPRLVVEVEFAQWTSDGHLRAPVFQRLRDDKTPHDVRRAEVSTPLASAAASATSASHDSPSGSELASEIASVLDQLDGAAKTLPLQVGGDEIALTNLDKVMWPKIRGQRALTKRDLLVYFAGVAPLLLPQLRDRPVTLTRYPNGIDGDYFYQKHNEQAPPFVETVGVHANNRDQQFMLCNNLATLLWLGQVADLALHSSLARIDPAPDGRRHSTQLTGSREQIEASLLNYPDFVLFDLDPYIYSGKEGAGEEPELNRKAYRTTVRVAQWLKELLDSASLSSFVKTSGATGLHIYVPVLRNFDYAVTRSIAETLGGFLVRAHPREVTMEWSVEKRAGKVFFDANQNARIKNLASAYSPRAKPGAPVSMPLRWDELDDVYPTDFTILTAPERIASAGDLWAGILDAKHDIRALIDSA